MSQPTSFSRLHECLACRIATFTLTGMLTILVSANSAFGGESSDLVSRQARSAPQWVTRGVIHQIQPRAFTPEGTLSSNEPTLRLQGFDFFVGKGR